jgi:hypothetical protein
VIFSESQTEYDRLGSSLDRQKILAFAQHRAVMHGDQPGKASHVAAVGELAKRYVQLLCPDTDALERRYRAKVCEAAGFLHESLLQACSFELVVNIADEAVARIVAAMTPDWREPQPKRLILLTNQIGLASDDTQLVVLADIRH